MIRLKHRKVAKGLACYLALAVTAIGVAQRVYAGFSPSEAMNFSSYDRDGDLEKIQKVLETKMVSERLRQLGFTPEEIRARLDQLDNHQLHELAVKLDEVKVAGNGLGIVIALLVIAVLVVIFIYFYKRV